MIARSIGLGIANSKPITKTITAPIIATTFPIPSMISCVQQPRIKLLSETTSASFPARKTSKPTVQVRLTSKPTLRLCSTPYSLFSSSFGPQCVTK
jgi:hypothetical protein